MGDDILALERKSVQPYNSQDEYLWAMREDLADWFNKLYGLDINAENFFEVLDTGVHLCQHANNVQSFILQRLRENGNQWKHSQREASLLEHFENSNKGVQYRQNVRPQTFQARDNISNFITWARGLGLPDCLLFETNDLVELNNERSVILCLLEVARQGAKYGMEAPMIVQLEVEIDAEIAGEKPAPPPRQRITNDHRSLDEMVRDLVSRCTCPDEFPMIRVSEGKYRIGDSQTLIFVRILRKHVMVRIGGGWDTLENYLDRHDPCRCDAKALHGGKKLISPLKQKTGKPNVKSVINTNLSAITKPREVQPTSGRASPQNLKNVKQDPRRAMTPTKEISRRSQEGSLRPSTPNGHSRQNSTSDLSQCSDDSIPSVHSLRGSRTVNPTRTSAKRPLQNHTRSRSVEPLEYRPHSPKISPANSIKRNNKKGEVFLIARDSSGKHSFRNKGDIVDGGREVAEPRKMQMQVKQEHKLLPDKPRIAHRTLSNGSNGSNGSDEESPTEISKAEADWNARVQFLSTLPYENLPEPQPDEELNQQMEMLFEEYRKNQLRVSLSDELDGRSGRATPERVRKEHQRSGRASPITLSTTSNRRRTSSSSSATLSPAPGTNVQPDLMQSRQRITTRDTRTPRQLKPNNNNRARSVSPSHARQAFTTNPLNFKTPTKTKRSTGTRTEPSTPTSVRRALSVKVKQHSQDDLLSDALNRTFPISTSPDRHDKGAQTTDLSELLAKSTPRRDDKHFGKKTRIPQPVKFGDKDSYSQQSLKRYDSGVDINNVSPNDTNGQFGWPDDDDDVYY